MAETLNLVNPEDSLQRISFLVSVPLHTNSTLEILSDSLLKVHGSKLMERNSISSKIQSLMMVLRNL